MSEFALLGTFMSDGEVIQCECFNYGFSNSKGMRKKLAHIPKFTFLEERNERDKIIGKLHSKNKI